MGKQQEYFHTLIVISSPKSGHAKKLLIVDCFPHYSLYKKTALLGRTIPGESLHYSKV